MLRGAAPVSDEAKMKMLPNPMPKNVLSLLNHIYLYSAEINMPDTYGGILESMCTANESWMVWALSETP